MNGCRIGKWWESHCVSPFKGEVFGPGTVVHVNPALLEAEEGGSPEVRKSRPTWPTWWNPVSTKNSKISQMCWHVLVISALEGLMEENCWNLGGGGCSEKRLHHCTTAWETEPDSVSKKKSKRTHMHLLTYTSREKGNCPQLIKY